MADGHRTLTLTLTEAQRDVFHFAMDLALAEWEPVGHPMKSSRFTLQRAMEAFDKAWEEGSKR